MSFEDKIRSELRSYEFPTCFAGEVLVAVSLDTAVKVAVNSAIQIHQYDLDKFTRVLSKFCMKEFGADYKSKLDLLINELK